MAARITIGKGAKVEVGSMAKVSVGGDVVNYGDLKVHKGGELEVARHMLNTGNLSISDPLQVKEIVLEAIKTAKTYGELGQIILRKLGMV